MAESGLDLRAVEARFKNDLRPVRANDPLALRPLGYGEVETLLTDGQALLAHCRALRAALEELHAFLLTDPSVGWDASSEAAAHAALDHAALVLRGVQEQERL